MPNEGPGDPMKLSEARMSIPSWELPGAVLPSAVVPIRLPVMRLPVAAVTPDWISIPSPYCRRSRCLPRRLPIVLFDEPNTDSPVPLGIACVPEGVTPR